MSVLFRFRLFELHLLSVVFTLLLLVSGVFSKVPRVGFFFPSPRGRTVCVRPLLSALFRDLFVQIDDTSAALETRAAVFLLVCQL